MACPGGGNKGRNHQSDQGNRIIIIVDNVSKIFEGLFVGFQGGSKSVLVFSS